jgi:hypothetical protein
MDKMRLNESWNKELVSLKSILMRSVQINDVIQVFTPLIFQTFREFRMNFGMEVSIAPDVMEQI